MSKVGKRRSIFNLLVFVNFPPDFIFFFCSAGKAVNSLFVSPAVTPIKSVLEPYSNNPAYRMYLYDTSDFSVLVRMEKKFRLKKKKKI